MDVARWGIQDATLPKSVWSVGGRWVETAEHHKDQGETPNMLVVGVRLRRLPAGDSKSRGLNNRTIIEGNPKPPNEGRQRVLHDRGRAHLRQVHSQGADKSLSLGVEAKTGRRRATTSIFKNFIDCVRSRKRDDLHADVLEAHRSIGLCHLGNISYRLGEQVPGDTPIPVFGDNEEVQKSWQRIKQGLKDALGLDLASTTYQLGKLLEFDPEKERFVGNEAANELLSREYREPFVVPANV